MGGKLFKLRDLVRIIEAVVERYPSVEYINLHGLKKEWDPTQSWLYIKELIEQELLEIGYPLKIKTELSKKLTEEQWTDFEQIGFTIREITLKIDGWVDQVPVANIIMDIIRDLQEYLPGGSEYLPEAAGLIEENDKKELE